MLTSPLYAQKASVKPDAMVVQEREVSAQHTQADRKKFEVSFIRMSESFGETRCNVLIWTGKPDQEFCFQTRWSVESERISSWR